MKYATRSDNKELRFYLHWYAPRMISELLSFGILSFMKNVCTQPVTIPTLTASATAMLTRVIDAPELTCEARDDLVIAKKTSGVCLSVALAPGTWVISEDLIRSGHWETPVPFDTLSNQVYRQVSKANADERVRMMLKNPRSVGIYVKKPTERQLAKNTAYLRKFGRECVSLLDISEAAFVAMALHYDIQESISFQKEHASRVVYQLAKRRTICTKAYILDSETDWLTVERTLDYGWTVRTELIREVTLDSLRAILPKRSIEWIPQRPALSLAQHIGEELCTAMDPDDYAFRLLTNPSATLGVTEHELMNWL